METLLNWLSSNGTFLVGLAAVMCGIALLYLVMARTIKHREDTTDT